MDVNNKRFDVYFRRNNKERFWKVENTVDLYGFKDLLNEMLVKTKEQKLEIRLIIRSRK